jgi:ATP-dependent helicase/nuclease subunit B
MKIVVGLGYDSRKPNNQKAQFNTLVCGEAGLLDELEFRAGISHKPQHQAQRIVLFMKAIKETMTPERFYCESFSTDPLACAEELLRWSDWLSMHGWLILPTPDLTGRLSDLKDIRQCAQKMTPDTGTRLFSIVERLPLIKKAVDSIELAHSLSHWEPMYQFLFEKLRIGGIPVSAKSSNIERLANESSDLGILQGAIINNKQSRIKFVGDGSVRCYTTSNLQTGANFAVQGTEEQRLFIASGQHYALNTAAITNGFSEPGLGEASSLRAPNQLLPLILQCLWSPPSAQIVQQYLTLSAGKHQRLRRKLARLFADQPGFDISLWEKVTSDYIEDIVKRDASVDPKILKLQIDKWLPIGQANSNCELDIALAIETCTLVSEYWGSLICVSEELQQTNVYIVAKQSTDALLDAFRNWSSATISREQLNRLLDIVSDVGNSVYKVAREVSKLDIVETPESSFLASAAPNHLIWWDFKLGTLFDNPPLTEEELVCIPLYKTACTTKEHTKLSRSLAAILNTTTSLTVIVLNDKPDLLKLALTQIIGEDAWRSLDEELLANSLPRSNCKKINGLALPSEQRWWSLSTSVPAPRETESYSSLSTLVTKPYEYVLKYNAKLSEGSLVSLPFDARLKGNLSHKIIERWFMTNPWNGIKPNLLEIDEWFDRELDSIILSTALPLTAPGMRSERFNYQSQIRHAMVKLFEQLEQSGIQELLVEHKVNRSVNATNIEGTIDLFGKLTDGRWVIIDMKWGGRKRYQEELKNGYYLQLATYAHLAGSINANRVADVAYFILSEGTLITASPHIFPTATFIEPRESHQMPSQVWSAFKNTFEWRLKQLQAGRIEVTGGNAEADLDSEPNIDCLPLLLLEEKPRPQQTYGQSITFKRLNVWRFLTGQIKE